MTSYSPAREHLHFYGGPKLKDMTAYVLLVAGGECGHSDWEVLAPFHIIYMYIHYKYIYDGPYLKGNYVSTTKELTSKSPCHLSE